MTTTGPDRTDEHAIEDHNDQTAARASERFSFQLTYARAAQLRKVTPGWMESDPIPDAWEPGETSSGEWDGEDSCPDRDSRDRFAALVSVSEQGWLDHYAAMAVNEAVHEALEWAQVDGKPWLNPHGPSEDVIYELVDELCRKLAALRVADDREASDA